MLRPAAEPCSSTLTEGPNHLLFSVVTIWEGSPRGPRGEVRRLAMTEYAIRFFVGGLVVSAFAALGDVFRPKTFADFLVLATLVIALLKQRTELRCSCKAARWSLGRSGSAYTAWLFVI